MIGAATMALVELELVARQTWRRYRRWPGG